MDLEEDANKCNKFCYYDRHKDNSDAQYVLLQMRSKPLPLESRILSVDAFSALFPVFNSTSNQLFVNDIVFSDLKRQSNGNDFVLNQLIEQEVDRLLLITNYFRWIKSVTRQSSLKIYFGVLAMLLRHHISTGGCSSPFVKRCSVLYQVIAKREDVTQATDRIFKISATSSAPQNTVGEGMVSAETLDSFQIDMELFDHALRFEAPTDDISTIGSQIRNVSNTGVRAKIVRILRKLNKKIKKLIDKNKIRRASRKAIKNLNKVLQKFKRNSLSNHGSIDVGSKPNENQEQQSVNVLDENSSETTKKNISSSEGLKVASISAVDAKLKLDDTLCSPCINTSDSTAAYTTTHLSVDLPVTVEPSDPSDLSPYYSVQYYSDKSSNSDSEDESSNSDSSDYDSGFDGEGCEADFYPGQDDDTSSDALIAALLAAFDEVEEEQERKEGDENTKVAASCDTSGKDTSGATACTVAENASVGAKPKAKKSKKKSKVKVATTKDIEKAFKKLAIKN